MNKIKKKKPAPRRGGTAALRPVLLVNDAALNASDKTFTVPAGEEWEPLLITVELITTATAGNRTPCVYYQDTAGLDLARLISATTQAASLTLVWTWAIGLQIVGTNQHAPLPMGIVLPAGYRIRVFDSSVIAAAADDMTVRVFGYKRT